MRAAAKLIEQVGRLDPRELADRLIDAQGGRADWLDAFSEQLDRRRSAEALSRVLAVWQLNRSDAARLFGVSRQAVSKWFEHGVPAERAAAVADLAAATDLLVHHIKRERIPAVVRRKAPGLGGLSLLELIETGAHERVLQACRAMFEFDEAQG